MKRIRLGVVALFAALLSVVAVGAPAQAATGNLRVGQKMAATTVGVTYQVTAVSPDFHYAQALTTRSVAGQLTFTTKCLTDSKLTTTSVVVAYTPVTNKAVYELACTDPLLHKGTRWW